MMQGLINTLKKLFGVGGQQPQPQPVQKGAAFHQDTVASHINDPAGEEASQTAAAPPAQRESQASSQGRSSNHEPVESLSSDELWAKCRDLAYELRVHEAVRVAKQARTAYAIERGYEPSGATGCGGISVSFEFDGVAADLLVPAKWAVQQSLQNLTPNETREIVGSLIWSGIRGSSFKDSWEEMLLVTVGSNLRWPAFEEWFCRFKSVNKWPVMWEIGIGEGDEGLEDAKFHESQLHQTTEPLLGTIHELSLSARRVLFYGLEMVTPEGTGMPRHLFQQASSELISAGFARSGKDLSIGERLAMLPISKAREIQRKYGVKGARSKEEIAKNLISAVGEDRLSEELPPEDFLSISLEYQRLDRLQFDRFRAGILAHTLGGMIATYRNYKLIMEHYEIGKKRPKFKAILTDNCPFCREAAKNLKDSATVTLQMLPPFHPGCRCCL